MRRDSITSYLPWIGVALIVAVSLQPLWGAPPHGDDVRLHVYRIPIVNALWQAGVPYARWIPYLNYGYGSPLFTFYPPLSAYALTTLYWLAGQDAPVALNLLFALTIVIAAAGMYLLGRHVHGVLGGLLTTAYYVWSPHFLRQVFARASTANALAIALYPAATLAFLHVAQRPSARRVGLAALLLALVSLSHTAASFLFVGPLALLALMAVYGTPDLSRYQRRRNLRGVIIALILGLGLASFSWLPAVTEIRYTRYAGEAAKVDFREHFADAWEWAGQTVAGVHNQALPKTPGLVQIVVGAGGTALALLSLRARRRHRPAPHNGHDALTGIAGLLAFATLFLAISWSAPLWERSGLLRGLQFPWRLLDIPTFLLALSSGRVLSRSALAGTWEGLDTNRKAQRYLAYLRQLPVGSMLLVGMLVPFANSLPYVYPPRLLSLPRQLALADATSAQQQYLIYGLTGWGEYSASSIQSWPSAPLFEGADSNVSLSAKAVDPPPGITAVDGNPWSAVWQTRLTKEEIVTVAVHDFPGWQAAVDGDRVPVSVNDSGLIQLAIPEGEHRLELSFRRTPVRWLADGVSVASALAIVALFVTRRSRRDDQGAKMWSSSKGPAAGTRAYNLASAGMMVAFLALLLVAKVTWADWVDNPFVVHVEDGHVPGTVVPEYGNFNGEIRLVGYKIEEPDQLTLYWQALERPLHSYTVAIEMVDAAGTPRRTIMNSTPGQGVTTNWEPGQVTRDPYTLPMNLRDAPVGYYLFVSMLSGEEEAPYPLLDAPWTTAVPVGRVKLPPPIDSAIATSAQAIGARFDDAIALRHADVPKTISIGEPLEFTLYWESVAPVRKDYTVFVHLLDPAGDWSAGQDGQPLDGVYPTSYWEPGELITDHRILSPELSAGTYQLQLGLYQLATGERLPVSGPHSQLGDRVALGSIEVMTGDS